MVLVTGLTFLAFILFVLPQQAQRSDGYAEEVGSADTSFFLDPAQLYDMAEAYGPDGRKQYIRTRWTFDVLFPLIYSSFFMSAISFSLSRLFPERPKIAGAALIAVAALLADLLENSLMSLVMALYPIEIEVLAAAALVVSMLKWLLVAMAMAAAGAGMLLLAISKFRRLLKGA